MNAQDHTDDNENCKRTVNKRLGWTYWQSPCSCPVKPKKNIYERVEDFMRELKQK